MPTIHQRDLKALKIGEEKEGGEEGEGGRRSGGEGGGEEGEVEEIGRAHV